MNPQLETLIMLQDLDLMIKEMSDKATATQMSEIGFDVDAVDNLVSAREELEKKVASEYLAIYRRLMDRGLRAVVPVRDNTCLACFMKQPTKYPGSDTEVRRCNHCNRFLYYI